MSHNNSFIIKGEGHLIILIPDTTDRNINFTMFKDRKYFLGRQALCHDFLNDIFK